MHNLLFYFISLYLSTLLQIYVPERFNQIVEQDLFVAGEGGYHTYRIPSLLVTGNGTVLAFVEGRKSGQGDTGDIDLLMKKSTDGGRTWSKQVVIWDDGESVCGNPNPVLDEVTGDIHLLLTWNRGDDHEGDIITKKSKDTRRVFVMKSSDNGDSWSAPVDITKTTKNPLWGWYATGPGMGIQIKHGPNKGRLVIPANHSYDDPNGEVRGGPFEYGAHVIFSDDHGVTWELGGSIRPKMNESQLIEMADGKGTLLMNMRSYYGKNRRALSVSKDGGETWSDPVEATFLIEPVCQAAFIRYSWPDEKGKDLVLFSNPSSTKRENMTIKLSKDSGKTWIASKVLNQGPSAYSALAALPNGDILCLYEKGEKNPYEKLVLSHLSLDNLQ
ncbi:sialidase family protein [Cyclobacterium marinum]|uniref:sialidase family protein n=1 Tax=Cyclobacterium marinum TaxID=104 RepID=UPI0011EDF0D9|nr:sialidase family protein [Cyclobacterium marinum]MBI0397288.1 exo-alpha-sialidase [Cyclobacterium marinum]